MLFRVITIISFKLHGDAALSSKPVNHLKRKKLTMSFLVVHSVSYELQHLFSTLGVVKNYFLRIYLKQSHRSLQYDVNNLCTEFFSQLLVDSLALNPSRVPISRRQFSILIKKKFFISSCENLLVQYIKTKRRRRLSFVFIFLIFSSPACMAMP